MYFFNVNILIKQLLPPTWRVARYKFIKSLSKPLEDIKQSFDTFRFQSYAKVNLSAQHAIIENHIVTITGVVYGVYVADGVLANTFSVNVPTAGQPFSNQINQFLTKVTPKGRAFTLNFY